MKLLVNNVNVCRESNVGDEEIDPSGGGGCVVAC